MHNYQILLYYNYTPIKDPQKLCQKQKDLCSKLNLKGRILIAEEGINGTIEGLKEDTEAYISQVRRDKRFKNTDFKKSEGTGRAFPKLIVKVRTEIVGLKFGNKDIKPYEVKPLVGSHNEKTGKYLSPEELYSWIHSDKRFFIVDMRNDYEQAIGYFRNSILPPLKNSRDIASVLPILEELKDETIVTVCTGGVRCEKMSGFLLENGFNRVFQLYGGIVSYMEKYPNEDFLGKLYVFDGRIAMGFNTNDKKHVVVGKCSKCEVPADTYMDCSNSHCPNKRHFISCQDCLKKYGKYCSVECHERVKLHPDDFFQPYSNQ